MKLNYTHLVSIMDRSGSVERLINDMRGGFNSYLAEQEKLAGTCTVTTVIFDDEIIVLDDFIPIQNAARLTDRNYTARGSTALLDALGITIKKVGEKLAALPENERPEFVIVYVNTDGYENASSEYTREQIKNMVEEQQSKYNWKFLFLGANIDSFAEASSIGVLKAANYAATSAGVYTASANVSYSVSNLRSRNTMQKSADVEDYFSDVQSTSN